jgi:hypothetical protein
MAYGIGVQYRGSYFKVMQQSLSGSPPSTSKVIKTTRKPIFLNYHGKPN